MAKNIEPGRKLEKVQNGIYLSPKVEFKILIKNIILSSFNAD